MAVAFARGVRRWCQSARLDPSGPRAPGARRLHLSKVARAMAITSPPRTLPVTPPPCPSSASAGIWRDVLHSAGSTAVGGMLPGYDSRVISAAPLPVGRDSHGVRVTGREPVTRIPLVSEAYPVAIRGQAMSVAAIASPEANLAAAVCRPALLAAVGESTP